MKFEEISKILKQSAQIFIKNPILIVPSVLLWVFLVLLSDFSVGINHLFPSSAIATTWFVIFSIIYLGITSFFLSTLIVTSTEASKGEVKFKKIWRKGLKYLLGNFVIIVIIIIAYRIVNLVSVEIALNLGQALNLAIQPAQILLFVILFILTAGFLLFFLYSNFFLVAKKESIGKSIKKSFSLVRRNYIISFSITLVFFVLTTILSYTPQFVSVLIESVIIIPYATVVLTKIVLEQK